MPIQITCTNCSTSGVAPDNARGSTVRCKQCKNVIRIPDDNFDPDDLSHPDNWNRAMQSSPTEAPALPSPRVNQPVSHFAADSHAKEMIEQLENINKKLGGIWFVIVLLPALGILAYMLLQIVTAAMRH